MKYFKYIVVVFFSFSLLSCFEVVEDVNVTKNGSGSYKFILNLSQSRGKVANIMRMKTINNHKVPSKNDIVQKLVELKQYAKYTKGISNVSAKYNFDDYIFSFRCDFNQIENLNGIVEHFKSTKNIKKEIQVEHFRFTNKKLQRLTNSNFKHEFNKLKSEDRKVFNDATYTGIYRFENTITNQSNSLAKKSANKKASMIRVSINDIINEKSNIKNTIQIN